MWMVCFASVVSDIYTHGHHAAVLRSHTWRTVDNSAAYLSAFLVPGATVLDVGCGPGTITVEMAERVAPAQVVGIERVADPLGQARELAQSRAVTNVSFELGDAYALAAADNSYDVVHAHQVLQHLSNPVAALKEMLRVCDPDGVVAARDADYAAMTWYPQNLLLDRWLELYHAIAYGNQAEPDAGRRLLSWALQAGARDITTGASMWCFATTEERQWWGGLWAERVTASAFAEQAVARDLATSEELDQIAAAWLDWSRQPDGWFAVIHGEVLCRPAR